MLSQQHDADGSGHRVGDLQAGNRAVQIAQTVGDDQMPSAGQPLDQDAPGVPRPAGGRSGERRSDIAELRGGQPRPVGRAQRPARHADLPAGAGHFDQELRGQSPRTAAAAAWLELLPLHDAARDLREVPKLSIRSGQQVTVQQRGTQNPGHQAGQGDQQRGGRHHPGAHRRAPHRLPPPARSHGLVLTGAESAARSRNRGPCGSASAAPGRPYAAGSSCTARPRCRRGPGRAPRPDPGSGPC